MLTALAVTAGIGGAFASKIVGDSQETFYLDASGQPTDQVDIPNCLQSQNKCAQVWNVDANGNPTTPAGSVIMGTRQD
ncbi:hypothetical protein MUY27_00150 [Mucilaginibacter sp. RS28]|uniref:Uncharacterized protein n=1 Tax=Mucilaginibacter straminoryzae TaxID=2932774 RepID=A0A9X2B7V5_9SPHI|nr:hypothetical protein [Mucilaginibacter straminoryzae]